MPRTSAAWRKVRQVSSSTATRGSAWRVAGGRPRRGARAAGRGRAMARRKRRGAGQERPRRGARSWDAPSQWSGWSTDVIQRRERRRRDGTTYAVWRVRWHEADGAERNRTFDRRADAVTFEAKVRLAKRAG